MGKLRTTSGSTTPMLRATIKLRQSGTRRFAVSRNVTVGETHIQQILRRHDYPIQVLRRNPKQAKPKAVPGNLIGGIGLTPAETWNGKIEQRPQQKTERRREKMQNSPPETVRRTCGRGAANAENLTLTVLLGREKFEAANNAKGRMRA